MQCLRFLRVAVALVLAACLVSRAALGDEQTLRCQNGAVVTVSAPASEVGVEVLKRGGHAVDAAVATAFALAVTHPAAGNIGGGGYLLLAPAKGEPIVFDFREVAPAAATVDMFVQPEQRTPHRRVGVPGTVRGLALAHTRFGKLPWRELLQPAVQLAREGFALDVATAKSLNELLRTSDKTQFAELHRVFGQADGAPWKAGDLLRQPDLAQTLERIANFGPEGFYLGETAQLIAKEMHRGGGLVTTADLAAYQPKTRQPVQGTYRGREILSSPPSSSGGTTLLIALNILETFELDAERDTARNLHLLIESMKRAYRERARYLGDPDFIDIPDFLLAKSHAAELAKSISLDRATPSAALAGDIPLAPESEQTTHFSVIDRERNAIALTYTLENSYGSRVVVPGAGFLLNDEMNDFAWLPGVTDRTGRIGTQANQIKPGKRMLSSMTPTIVRKEGKVLLVTGSPGGRTIINTVLCMVTNVIDFRRPLREAVDAPRLHHQWFPDVVRTEPGLLADHRALEEKLKALGHTLGKPARQGDAHSIYVDPTSGEITAVADKRIAGKAAGY